MKNPWDERYASTGFYYGTAPNTFLKEQIQYFKPDKEVLCIAEGEGRNAVFLASLGCQVTAVDASEVGLTKLSRLAEEHNVHVKAVCEDLSTYRIESNEWDAIVSIWCHLPRQLRSQVHEKVVEGLRTDGIFILEAYTPEQLKYKTGGPQDPNMMPTRTQLTEEFMKLKTLWMAEMTREISEGVGHQGTSAVIQYIGQKGLILK